MSLAIATIGCGKKITESDSKAAASTTSPNETTSSYVLTLESSQGNRKQFRIPRDTSFYIPAKLSVRSGSVAGRTVEMNYNVNEYDNDYYDFTCTYVPSTVANEMKLKDCSNEEGSFGDSVGEYEFSLYQNQIIEMNLTGGQTSDLIIDAFYLMDWQ